MNIRCEKYGAESSDMQEDTEQRSEPQRDNGEKIMPGGSKSFRQHYKEETI